MSAALGVRRELEFDADSWNDISPADRVRRCLLFAQEADQRALSAAPEVREAYLEIARQWLDLAAEIQRSSPDLRLSS